MMVYSLEKDVKEIVIKKNASSMSKICVTLFANDHT